MTVKYAHFVLNSANVLTIASQKSETPQGTLIILGFSLCNTKEDRYDRKIGNQIAYQRMNDEPYGFYIEERFVKTTYHLISLRLIQVIRSIIEAHRCYKKMDSYKNFNSKTLINDLFLLEYDVLKILEQNISKTLKPNVYRMIDDE